MGHGYFITGTDTGVGKTYVTCALLRAIAEKGLLVAGYKPVAAGGVLKEGVLLNEDAEALLAASSLLLSYSEVNPICLSAPVSPHIAAALESCAIDIDGLVRGAKDLQLKADVVLAEGAGGWRVPLTERDSVSDFGKKLSWPVLLVVGMRLGCINHARLTLEAMLADQVEVVGWVANYVDPELLCSEKVLETLEGALSVPLLVYSDFQASHLRWTEAGLRWYENNCK